MMQHTINMLAQVAPKKLKALGENWEPHGEGANRYFTKIE